MKDISEDFILEEDQLQQTISVLEGKYSETEIILVHASILATPRFINLQIIPTKSDVINLMNPDFRMDIYQIATTLRIVGLSKYGMMMSKVLNLNWDDIRDIILSFQKLDVETEGLIPAYWIAKFVDLKKCRGECPLMRDDAYLATDIFNEIGFCDLIADFSFGEVVVDNDILEFISLFKKTLSGLYEKFEKEEQG